MSEPNSERLTLKQQAFVDAITAPETFGNGLQSAQKAGYNGSYSTLGVVAHDNLKNPKVTSAIQKRLAKIMSSDDVLVELSEIGKHTPKKHSPYNGNHKLKALELLGKYHDLFNERPNADVIVEAIERLGAAMPFLAPAMQDVTDNAGVIDVGEDGEIRSTEGESAKE